MLRTWLSTPFLQGSVQLFVKQVSGFFLSMKALKTENSCFERQSSRSVTVQCDRACKEKMIYI